MPTLIFTNGTRKHVEYSVASKILDVLECRKEPENKEQRKFCEQIKDIEFTKPVEDRKHDEVMTGILKADYKTGHDKFVAVAKRIRERTI